MEKGYSYNRQVWRRLLRNRPAVFGLLIITVTMLTALFAYAIAREKATFNPAAAVEARFVATAKSRDVRASSSNQSRRCTEERI